MRFALKYGVAIVLGFVLAVTSTALAGVVVDQGQGNPTQSEWFVFTGARRSGRTTEVLVTNAAGGSTVPATALTQRKSIELQNLGPNAIYCTIDGTSPVVLKARAIATNGTWALDVGPSITVKCIAATAAQLTTAATIVTEVQ